MEIQLASKSPRRRELLSQIGVRYKTVDVDVPELREAQESASAYVSRLAISKARAGAMQAFDGPTLGADTIVVCAEEVLEKPKDLDDFKRMMALLSGNTHTVMTAIALCSPGRIEGEGSESKVSKESKESRELQECSHTQVKFREISSAEAEHYWRTGEPQDKAGGYAIQGLGAVFVTEIIGSYSGVVGLPIETLSPMLAELGIPVWNT